ncbi:MAG: DUF979 domain-containing protein [Steroidobacteraceae bacterium]
MIELHEVYALAGAMFAAFALLSVRDRSNPRRWGNGAFWALLAVSFLFGSRIGDTANGVLVVGLILLGGTGALGRGSTERRSAEERAQRAARRGNALLVPALLIPLLAVIGTFTLGRIEIGGMPLADPNNVTLISLAVGISVALLVALWQAKAAPQVALEEGRRLADMIGWALILPQLLAALGAVFALAGVGGAVGHLATTWLALGHPFSAVLVYCVGMALFTMVMGNAFAAFPVMSAAIGVPLIVQRFGGDPAIMGAIGMLSGFCGTLVTPMAANFNIVPAVLLELADRSAVIKVQIPTAIALLACNIVLMYALVFRF